MGGNRESFHLLIRLEIVIVAIIIPNYKRMAIGWQI